MREHMVSFHRHHKFCICKAQSPPTTTLRFVDPKARSDFVTRMWHNVTQTFESPSDLRMKVMDSFPDRSPVLGDFQIGYLGTKRWIESPEDLAALNHSFSLGDEITLWCEVRHSESKRKKGDDNDEATCSKRAKHDQEVDKAYKKASKTSILTWTCQSLNYGQE